MKREFSVDKPILEVKGNFTWGLTDHGDEVGSEMSGDEILNKRIHLKDIDIKIKKGDLVVVVGEMGSGKTSLLNAILGEMISVPAHKME